MQRAPRRVGPVAAAVALLVLAMALASCGRSESHAVEVTVNGSPLATAMSTQVATLVGTSTATATATETPTPPPSDVDGDNPGGFAFPIAGGCLPGSDLLMPNAPREYRNGVHEGLDFYNLSSCAIVQSGTPILAAYDGVVVRADLDYVDITPEQVTALAEKTAEQGYTDPETLDIYRGRQVWIDHGDGIVTRYAHMLSIAEGIAEGVSVARGQEIGAVGESGTPESITAPGSEMHLHFEVRVGESFLGADLSPTEVRALYQQLFAPVEDEAPADDGDGESSE